MPLLTLKAAVLACTLSGHKALSVVQADDFIQLVQSMATDGETEPCTTEGRESVRIESVADPPLSDVTGITPTEPPGTGPGMEGPFYAMLAP